MKQPSEIVNVASLQWLEAVISTQNLPGLGDAEREMQSEIATMEIEEAPDPANLLAMAHVILTIADSGKVLSSSFYIDKAQAFIRRAMDLQALLDEAANAGALN